MTDTLPENPLPGEIERRSFEIITAELDRLGKTFPAEVQPIVKRVIHASADFDYADALYFSPGAVSAGMAALARGADIVTDTRMAMAGINAAACRLLGCSVHCHMADGDVAERAARQGVTRARAAADKAAAERSDAVFVVGNAPTALIRICELTRAGTLRPCLIVGAPVGFVNVEESKALLMELAVPHIAARGRKGGSAVAAAIVNALLRQARPPEFGNT